MCWSGEASTVLAAVGLGSTLIAARRGTATALWVPLGYFSLMEALQAYTYLVINSCSLASNQISTLLGYLHIAFQPFFINMIAMHFIPQDVAKRIAPAVYALCFAATVMMLITLYPLDSLGHCVPGRPLCGAPLCSVSGNWHIAWQLPLNGLHEMVTIDIEPLIRSVFLPYALVAFVLPYLYGSWRLNTYHIIVGPLLAKMLTDNPNEWPAVWCLLSIGILLLVVKTPLRQWLYIRKWYLPWPRGLKTA